MLIKGTASLIIGGYVFRQGKVIQSFISDDVRYKLDDSVDEREVGTVQYNAYLGLRFIQEVSIPVVDAAPEESIKGINFKELSFIPPYITKGDGYGSSSIALVKHLNKYTQLYVFGCSKVHNMDFGVDESTRAIVDRGFKQCDVVLSYGYPNYFKKFFNTKIAVGYTMWETTKLPQDFIIKSNEMDLIISPAEAVKTVMQECGIDVPIAVAPLGIAEEFSLIQRDYKSRDTFTFLTLGAMDTFNRKGWQELVDAFMLAFPKSQYPHVKLIIKTKPNYFWGKHDNWLKDNRIQWVSQWLDIDKHMKMLADADVFCFTTHGEGFGLPPLEALSTGLPVIVTDAMGMSEWVSEDYCELIKTKELEPAVYPDGYKDIGLWSKVDVNEVANRLLYTFNHIDKCRAKAEAGALIVKDKYSYDNTAKKIVDAITNLEHVKRHQTIRIAPSKKIKAKLDGGVSIIMPTYGHEKLIYKAIDAIQENCSIETELVIIDDGYGLDIIGEGIKFIKSPDNVGFASSVNKGIKASSGKYIILINSDVFIKKGCIEQLIFALDNYADIAGAKLYYPDGTIQHAGMQYGGGFNFIHQYWHQADGGYNPSYCIVTGALMGFKRELTSKIGLMDEQYFLALEDVDYCFRAKQAGHKVIYWSYAEAIHLEGATRGNSFESKMIKNPEGLRKEQAGHAYFKSKYSEGVIRELCSIIPFLP